MWLQYMAVRNSFRVVGAITVSKCRRDSHQTWSLNFGREAGARSRSQSRSNRQQTEETRRFYDVTTAGC